MIYDPEAHIRSYDGKGYRGESDPPDEWDLTYWDCGYSFCRPCGQFHRLPECAIEGTIVMKELEASVQSASADQGKAHADSAA